jgi:hypothetical protein
VKRAIVRPPGLRPVLLDSVLPLKCTSESSPTSQALYSWGLIVDGTGGS